MGKGIFTKANKRQSHSSQLHNRSVCEEEGVWLLVHCVTHATAYAVPWAGHLRCGVLGGKTGRRWRADHGGHWVQIGESGLGPVT